MLIRFGVVLPILFTSYITKAELASVSDPQILIFSKTLSGEYKTNIISEKIFRYSFGKALDQLHRRALTNIDKFKQTTKEFKMSRVIVGLKLESEFSVAKIIDLGVESAFDLRYEPLPKLLPKAKERSRSKSKSSKLVVR